MQSNDYLEQLAKKFENKYSGYIEIYRLTKELEDVLNRNDKQSIAMVMRMRSEEMDKINTINKEISEMYGLLQPEQLELIKNHTKYDSFPEEIQKIVNIIDRNNRVIEKTVEIDSRLNKRIAGNKSFYINK